MNVEQAATASPTVARKQGEPLAVLRIDMTGKVISVEGAELSFLGEPVSQLGDRLLLSAWARPLPIAALAVRRALLGTRSSLRITSGDERIELTFEPRLSFDREVEGCLVVLRPFSAPDEAHVQAQAYAHHDVRFDEPLREGSWEWDLARDRMIWSRELIEIHGADSQQLGGYQACLARVHSDDASSVGQAVRDGLRAGGSVHYRYRIVRPDGEVRMLETRATMDLVEQRVSGHTWDLTQLWRANRELAQSLSVLQATLDATSDGLLVVGLDGKVAAFNRRFVDLWRLPQSLLDSRDNEAMVSYVIDQLEDPASFRGRLREMSQDPDASSFDVLWFKDGRVFERHARPQHVASWVVGRVSSFHDVTDRERLLRTALFLSDASRLLGTLDVERALEAVARLSVPFMGDGCCVDLCEAEGTRRLLSIVRDPSLTLPPKPPCETLSGRSVIDASGERSTLSVALQGRAGNLGALTFVAARERSYGPSDRQLAEELARRAAIALENAQLYADARDALQVRDEFLAIAAHEIRGPVTSIHLAAQTLDNLKLDAGARARMTGVLQREDRRLTRFVDELLDVGRIRNRRFHFELEEMDLVEVTRDVLNRLELSRSGTSISLSAAGPISGTWDRQRLDQLVTNLLSNALKFGMGKPIEVDLRTCAGEVVLVVRDHGMGMSAELQRRIFDPFERGVSSRQYGGLGLGLYIVRAIAEGLGGSVQVASAAGEGSTFTVRLPRTRA